MRNLDTNGACRSNTAKPSLYGAIRKSSAYADHAAVADALREYIAGRKA